MRSRHCQALLGEEPKTLAFAWLRRRGPSVKPVSDSRGFASATARRRYGISRSESRGRLACHEPRPDEPPGGAPLCLAEVVVVATGYRPWRGKTPPATPHPHIRRRRTCPS